MSSKRRPHNRNIGYVTERKVQHPIGGYVVIYDREDGFDCDADERWILQHEPSGRHVAVHRKDWAYQDMKTAALDPLAVFGEDAFDDDLTDHDDDYAGMEGKGWW